MSTKARKREKQLQAYAKKRERRPESKVKLHGPLKISHTVEKRIIRDHKDLLQNVEFSLVKAAADAVEFDDSVVEQTLRHLIQGSDSLDSTVSETMSLIESARQIRTDISDELWQDTLRVVYNSLKNHSTCKPGDTSYLSFVSQFVR